MSIPQDINKTIAYEVGFLRNLLKMPKNPPPAELDTICFLVPGAHASRMAISRFEIGGNDWRPAFYNIGAPLAYIAGFKIIDLIVEKLLGINPNKMMRFEEKVERLEKLEFSGVMKENRILRDCLISLFKNGYKIRNVLVHRSTFSADGGGVNGTIVQRDEEDAEFSLSWDSINGLAAFGIHLSEAIAADSISRLEWKHLRLALDRASALHKGACFHQARPGYSRAQIFRLSSDNIEFDFKGIVDLLNAPLLSMDTATRTPYSIKEHDLDVEIEVVLLGPDAEIECVYRIPHDVAAALGPNLPVAEISRFKSIEPVDIKTDLVQVVRDLRDGKKEMLSWK